MHYSAELNWTLWYGISWNLPAGGGYAGSIGGYGAPPGGGPCWGGGCWGCGGGGNWKKERPTVMDMCTISIMLNRWNISIKRDQYKLIITI